MIYKKVRNYNRKLSALKNLCAKPKQPLFYQHTTNLGYDEKIETT